MNTAENTANKNTAKYGPNLVAEIQARIEILENSAPVPTSDRPLIVLDYDTVVGSGIPESAKRN